MPSRRDVLLALAALAVQSAALPGANGQTPSREPTLRDLARRRGIMLGAQLEPAFLAMPEFASFVAANFDLITPGNQLKWGTLCSRPQLYDFRGADVILEFALEHQIRMRGHNLCWNNSNPPWLTSVLTRQNARGYLELHIQTVAGRYKGKIDSWDVVNEPIRINAKRPDGLSTGPWLDMLGPEYIDIAFHCTASVDPSALRVLNLDNTEQEWPASAETRKASLALIRALLKRGVPVQAIGLESHLEATLPVPDPHRTSFIKELQSLGLEVMCTELDVNDTSVQAAFEGDRRRAVAKCYHDYLVDLLSVSGLKRLIFWTISDLNNWYDWSARRSAYYSRSDSQPHLPGLLTADLKPAPALAAVRSALS